MTNDDEIRAHAEYVDAVGHIITDWVSLELSLVLLAATILRIDQFRARVIWTTMPNLRARSTLLRRLADTFIDDALFPEFRRLARRVDRLGARRNLVAHGLIHHFTRTHVILTRDGPSDDFGFDVDVVEIQLTSVKGWVPAIGRLSEDILDFLPKLGEAVHTSPKMHRAGRTGRPPSSARGRHRESTPGAPPTQPAPSRGSQ